MVPPVTAVTSSAGKALNPKNVITAVVMIVVITLIMQYVMKQEVIITDNTGAVIGRGDIKSKISIGKNK